MFVLHFPNIRKDPRVAKLAIFNHNVRLIQARWISIARPALMEILDDHKRTLAC
jgi:hypothetical protein